MFSTALLGCISRFGNMPFIHIKPPQQKLKTMGMCGMDSMDGNDNQKNRGNALHNLKLSLGHLDSEPR